jgi:hypothetical protein
MDILQESKTVQKKRFSRFSTTEEKHRRNIKLNTVCGIRLVPIVVLNKLVQNLFQTPTRKSRRLNC